MNKAITDGINFMPPAFENGLDVWSSGDGTQGSDTLEGAANVSLVADDPDFGTALEITKTDAVQRLRYMGETPILPGCYLQISARLKVVSGDLPNVRIAAWAGAAGGTQVTGVPESGPQVGLGAQGKVVEVSAIVGTGQRTGVDMVWGREPIFGHFGLDLTGPSGGVVRIESLEIRDVTRMFLRDLINVVDVRDFGAIGDGVTDDGAAFEAADAAANGREVLVPDGVYCLGDSITFDNPVRFRGTISMPDDKVLALTRNYDLPSYIEAFGDEELAFKKAFQALLNNVGHDALDMGGRAIGIRGPIDMQAAVANKDTFAQRRHIRNGQISVYPGPDWDTEVVTSQADYDVENPLRLTQVREVATIPVGSLVEGAGVGREVYVQAKDVDAQEITLSAQLGNAQGSQSFTFTRFKYMLDFSGFAELSKFSMSNMEFQCSGDCSGILLPPSGSAFHLRDCFITRPRNRGITSHGQGDQGMMVDRCQFLSDESPLLSTQRQSIALNTNANDIKLRNNRAVHFRHFAVVGGSSSLILGNHWFQGDTATSSGRTAGLVLMRTNNRGTITGNYVDNSYIEWTNEQDAAPEFASEFSFSSLSITDNVFAASHVDPAFKFIVVKPHGSGHFLNGCTVTGNSFRVTGNGIDRVEGVDKSVADLDYNRFANFAFRDNMFSQVSHPASSPLVFEHTAHSPAATWVVDLAPMLPFGAWAQTVTSVMAAGPIRDSAGEAFFGMPYYRGKKGANKDQIKLSWGTPVQGTVILTARVDDPF